MDTNETLTRIRQLLDNGHGSRIMLGDEGFIAELTGCMQDLDDGLSRGFFLPEGWRHPRLDEWTRELATVAITHKYALDAEGITQLRDDRRGELAQALLAALKGDWTKVEGHTVHVRAGVELRAYARQEGFTLPSMADRVTPGDGVNAVIILERKDEYIGRAVRFKVGNLDVHGTLVSIWERGYFNHPDERLMIILENNHQYRVGYRTPVMVEPAITPALPPDRVTLEPVEEAEREAGSNCGQRWVAEIELCPRCGLSAAEH